jgi:type IV pilus assembly protein PilB
MPVDVGKLFLREGRLTEGQVARAKEHARQGDSSLSAALVALGLVDDDEIAALLSKAFRVPAVDVRDLTIERHYGSEASLVPVGGAGGLVAPRGGEAGGRLTAADLQGLGGLASIGTDDLVEEDGEAEERDDDSIDLAALNQSGTDSSTIALMNRILVAAVQRGASDIHIEPYEKYFRVRIRVDGVLEEIATLPNVQRDPLIQRVKIMARLNIAERRLPQGGRFKRKIHLDGRSLELDYRVSVLPTLRGEKAVLRLLDRSKLMLDMTKLGFEPGSLERFKRAVARPYGIVLVTGPTGSGKTNTLYSALSSLNRKDTNIMTAEDPVEFELEGINQVQIREEVGLGFAQALREFLRQDPNVILVGEIRDYETAEIAVKASLTGHLVLSTLHTNDAPSTVSRLVNMGIEPYLVGTAVHLIQAQRLVRRICASCKADVTSEVPAEALVEIGFAPGEIDRLRIHRGRGCDACRGTGLRERVGLYEVMEVTDALRDLILVGATAVEIRRKALEEGMLTLRASGLQKIRDGVTTIDEVRRETVA